MAKTLKKMFLAVEVNLILWLVVFGAAKSNNGLVDVKLVTVGFVFAAVIQHWAYYACYKKAKEIASAES